jgi:hypothetical protein
MINMDKREEELKVAEITINAFLTLALAYFAYLTAIKSYSGDVTMQIASGGFAILLIIFTAYVLAKGVWKIKKK